MGAFIWLLVMQGNNWIWEKHLVVAVTEVTVLSALQCSAVLNYFSSVQLLSQLGPAQDGRLSNMWLHAEIVQQHHCCEVQQWTYQILLCWGIQ